MIKQTLSACGILLVVTGCATAQEAPSDEPSVPGWLKKDFSELVGLFPGQWDSDRHVFFAADAGMDENMIAPRQHIEITPLDDADQPDNATAFQATRTVAGAEPAALRHTFSVHAESQSVRQEIAVPGEAGSWSPIDCHVDWKRSGPQFQGAAAGDACSKVFQRPSGGGALKAHLMLSEKDFWVSVSRGENKIESRLRRARPFECWTAILRGAEHGDSGEGMRDWDFRRGVKLHDQGGEAELITDEETPRRIRLRLRNVDWPYGTNRPSLTLYILEGDSDRAVSYAWNEGDAERIGINLRWLQASCTHTPG
jgi:hypothetical protein